MKPSCTICPCSQCAVKIQFDKCNKINEWMHRSVSNSKFQSSSTAERQFVRLPSHRLNVFAEIIANRAIACVYAIFYFIDNTTDTFIHKLKYTIQWQYILKIRLVLVRSSSHHQQQKKIIIIQLNMHFVLFSFEFPNCLHVCRENKMQMWLIVIKCIYIFPLNTNMVVSSKNEQLWNEGKTKTTVNLKKNEMK